MFFIYIYWLCVCLGFSLLFLLLDRTNASVADDCKRMSRVFETRRGSLQNRCKIKKKFINDDWHLLFFFFSSFFSGLQHWRHLSIVGLVAEDQRHKSSLWRGQAGATGRQNVFFFLLICIVVDVLLVASRVFLFFFFFKRNNNVFFFFSKMYFRAKLPIRTLSRAFWNCGCESCQ